MGQAIKFLDCVLSRLLVVLMLFLSVVIFVSIFCRFVLNDPIIWSDEISRYSMIALTFLGMGHVVKDRKEIFVGIIDTWVMKLMKTRGKKVCAILDFLSDLIVVALLCIMIVYGIRYATFKWLVKGETLDWMRMGYVYGLIPLGSTLGLLYLFRRWYLRFKAPRTSGDADSSVKEIN